uniref:Uncharacterized protein n=1 Tax=Rhodogorgon sp. TaxID=2485824 RepID=A0A3G3MI53_9FLOR|nr:hypothetical protein [Rhodogorgon sp.]
MLFNLVFIQHGVKRSNYTISSVGNPIGIIKYQSRQSSLYNNRLICFASNLNLMGKSTEDLAKAQLIQLGFFRNLVNNYWQETIFLSTPTAASEKYANRLKLKGIATSKTYQKHFLYQFGKALMKGRIESIMVTNPFHNSLLPIKPHVKYIWKKGLNIKYPIYFGSALLRNLGNFKLKKTASNFVTHLNLHKLPVFVLVNHLGQMVIAEPPDELSLVKTIPDIFYRWYDNSFLYRYNNRPVYEGWFFINSQDAEEYCKYIRKKYPLSESHKDLRVFTCSLETFYKMSRKGCRRIHFRLIPDLGEVGRLVTGYKHYSNIKFFERQEQGKDYFQGQPIYLIQDIYDKNNNRTVKYNYQVSGKSEKTKYQAVFTNYQTAVKAWKIFIRYTPYGKLSNKPNLIVYNLEDFLKDQENHTSLVGDPFLFIPSQKVYTWVKMNQIHSFKNKPFLTYLLHIKSWGQRIFWSLTSRQPHSW